MLSKTALTLATTLAALTVAMPHPLPWTNSTHLSKRQWEPCAGYWGQPCWGDITYYDPSVGPGSCGTTYSEWDPIVAIAGDIMYAQGVANPNENPLCGKTITISYGGQTAQATVTDTCDGCTGQSIDLSPGLFQVFASLDTGRVSGVQWWFED